MAQTKSPAKSQDDQTRAEDGRFTNSSDKSAKESKSKDSDSKSTAAKSEPKSKDQRAKSR